MTQNSSPFSTVIAIDGPSASGKGTVARRLAEKYDYAYLDTGLLYRAVGMLAFSDGVDLDDTAAIAAFAQSLSVEAVLGKLPDPLLRGTQGASAASKVSAVPEVRAMLLNFQRNFASQPPDDKKGAVLDGRDIGTVIAPAAPVKLYITAAVETRADRRWKELRQRDETATYEAVLADLRERDARDSGRAHAPALPAADAIILDNTKLNADETFIAALKIVQDKLANRQ